MLQRVTLWVWWQHEDAFERSFSCQCFFFFLFSSEYGTAYGIPRCYITVFIFAFIQLADTFIRRDLQVRNNTIYDKLAIKGNNSNTTVKSL